MPNLISPCPLHMADYTVSQIIDPTTQSWNVTAIQPYLLPFEIAAIHGTPLSVCGASDTVTWSASPDGTFSVRTAYRLLLGKENALLPGTSSRNPSKDLWKSIWSLSTTPTVRNFLWRACNGALPTKIALWKRNVLTNPMCEQCKSGVEDSLHALWSCPVLAPVWLQEHWLGSFTTQTFLDFTDVVSTVLASCSKREAALFGVIAWLIWHVRNKKRLKQQGESLEGINQRALELVLDLSPRSGGGGDVVIPQVMVVAWVV
jgi:hypothetical protein